MELRDLYPTLSTAERSRLAANADMDPGYLWQIATQWRGKKASVAAIARLTKADRRLKAADLVREFSERHESVEK